MEIEYIVQELAKRDNKCSEIWLDYGFLNPYNQLVSAKKALAKLPDTTYYKYRIIRRTEEVIDLNAEKKIKVL